MKTMEKKTKWKKARKLNNISLLGENNLVNHKIGFVSLKINNKVVYKKGYLVLQTNVVLFT